MIRVAAITSGKNVPSRRFRIDALTPFLARRGIKVNGNMPRHFCISTYFGSTSDTVVHSSMAGKVVIPLSLKEI